MKDLTAPKAGFWTKLFAHPGWALALFVAFTVILWTVQCAVTQNILPLDVIETIVWGRQGQWGHYRHPPLSGWLGYAFFSLSGGHDWSMYLGAQLCIACGVYYVYRLGKEFFSEAEAATGTLLLYILFYYTPSSMKFCSHFTITALMPAMAFYFYRGVRDNKLCDWALFGAASALACLGKYAAVQLFPACLAVMLLTPEGRSRFRSPGVYLAVIIFFAVLSPHIYWLSGHDWGPLRHLTERVEDTKEPWYHPLLALGTLIYPFFLCAAVLAAALALPLIPQLHEKRPERQALRRYPLTVLSLFALVPGLVYVVIAFCGGNVILMWFSFLASWTGLVVAAACPYKIDHAVFRRVFWMLAFYVFCMFIGTNIDILVKTRLKLHADPASFTQAAEDFWQEHTGSRKIPVVYGPRWEAGVIETYSVHHPAACVEDDPVNLALVRETIAREGALVFTDNPRELARFYTAIGRSAPLEKKVSIPCHAPFGKVKVYVYDLAYLPPEKPVSPPPEK